MEISDSNFEESEIPVWTRLEREEDQPFDRRGAEVPLSLVVLGDSRMNGLDGTSLGESRSGPNWDSEAYVPIDGRKDRAKSSSSSGTGKTCLNGKWTT